MVTINARINLHLQDALYDRVKEEAENQGATATAIINRLIADALDYDRIGDLEKRLKSAEDRIKKLEELAKKR